MDLDLQYEELKCYSCVLNTVTRREETQEAIVSDALPDIGTVGTATATPFLTLCRAETGSAIAEGELQATVLYVPEEGGSVCAIPVRVPFRATVEAGELTPDCRMNVLPSLLGVDVKVMNPRKVLLQAELSVRFLAFAERETRFSVGAQDEEAPAIQTKLERISYQYVSQVTEKTFPFEESVSLSGGHRSVERIVSCDIAPYCTEAKIVGSRVVFKGGVKAHMRFLTANGELTCESYDLPVSQVLDAGNSSESAVALVSLAPVSLQAELLERDSVAFSMELYACAVLIDQRQTSILADAYSTRCPCTCSTLTNQGLRLLDHNTMIHPFRQSMDVELPAAEVLDQTATLAEVFSGSGEEATKCRLKVSACLRERDGQLTRVEQNCYVKLPTPKSDVGTAAISVQLIESTCISAAGGMEVRGSLLIQYAAVQSVAFRCLERISLEESAPVCGENQPSAVLRMLRSGETLWDLGKEYFASVEDIMAVNQISDDSAADGRFLLIPRSR